MRTALKELPEPFRISVALRSHQVQRKTEAVSTAVTGGIETVLLAEDEELVRKFVQSILEKSGYTVLEAHHGSEALRVALQHDGAIHLLILVATS